MENTTNGNPVPELNPAAVVPKAQQSEKVEKVRKEKKASKGEKVDAMLIEILEKVQEMRGAIDALASRVEALEQRAPEPEKIPIQLQNRPGVEILDESGATIVQVSRKGAAQNRTYELVKQPQIGNEHKIARQGVICMAILFAYAKKEGNSKYKDKLVITEAQAMTCLAANQALISLTQEAWKVFCFYRANLNKYGYVRMLNVV